MQFSLVEPVVSEVVNTAESSTAPTDATTVVIGAGSALGTGANSQMLQFYQVGENFFAANNFGDGPTRNSITPSPSESPTSILARRFPEPIWR
jgi:hypothetical protein